MAVFSIYDGRNSFWQWDVDQRLVVSDDVCNEVHFCNGTTECALVCHVYEHENRRVVDVPNILLQTAGSLRVFVYRDDENGRRTMLVEIFSVAARSKPDDYVYTQTEVWTAEKAVAEALQEAKDSGDFDGPPGPKGDPGVVKFKVVNELPETDTENAIYLVPVTDGAEDNLFDEFIFIDGKWEKIGSAAVAVDMTGYVKNTDYPNGDTAKAGIVKVNPTEYGVGAYPTTGYLYLVGASKAEIDGKVHYRHPVMPQHLDYAVKKGLADSKEEWTEEEKKAARDLVGAVGANDYGSNAKPGLVQGYVPYGIYVNPSTGIMSIVAATNDDIDAKKDGYRAITPPKLDYAVKKSLADNKEEWSEDEQTAARGLIGAVGATDIATDKKAGLVRIHGAYGTQLFGDLLVTVSAENNQIDAKSHGYHVITPKNLDYAVKAGITANTITLTDEEKAAAQEWLGLGNIEAALDGIIAIQNELIGGAEV